VFDAKGSGGEVRIAYKPIAQFGAWELANGVITSEDIRQVDPVGVDLPGPRTVRVKVGQYWMTWAADVHSYEPYIRAVLTGKPRTRQE
jgi:hypothetical protein